MVDRDARERNTIDQLFARRARLAADRAEPWPDKVARWADDIANLADVDAVTGYGKAGDVTVLFMARTPLTASSPDPAPTVHSRRVEVGRLNRREAIDAMARCARAVGTFTA